MQPKSSRGRDATVCLCAHSSARERFGTGRGGANRETDQEKLPPTSKQVMWGI